MTCIVCGNKTEIAQRTGKTKKYCSRKCAHKFHHNKVSNEMRAQTDGPTPCLACGKMVERFLKSNKPKKYCSKKCNRFFCEHKMTFKEFEEKNQWVLDNCIHLSEVCEQLGIHQVTLRNRMINLGFEKHKCVIGGQTYYYVEKTQIESIKNEGIGVSKEMPKGWCYIKEAGELLQFETSNPTSISSGIKDLEERMDYTTNSKMENIEGKPRKIYEIKTLHKLLELKKEYYTKDCKNCGEKFYESGKHVFCSSTCSDEYLVKEAEQRRKEFEQEWATQDEVVSKLEKIVRIGNYKRPTLTHFAKSNEKYFIKVGGRFLSKRDSVEKLEKIILKDFIAYHKQLEKDAEIKKQERFEKLIVRREDNWQDWWVREEKLISDFPEKIKKWEEKHKTSTHQHRDTKLKSYIRAVSRSLEYHQKRIHKGEVVEFQCKKCEEVFPFYEFRFDETTKTGRRGRCRECGTQKYNPEKRKAARQKNYRGRLRAAIGISVKAHISKQNNSYAKGMSVPKVWKAIEEKCGYNIDDLVKHIESKFTNKMNWQNQKTPRNPGEFGWHLDHIIPHSKLSYNNLEHPNFAKAWCLSNLQPLQARMNLDKSNKKLIVSHRASFISGIKAALEGKEKRAGIWKYLSYTNIEAKEKLESLFESPMSWKNYAELWEIDHHNPIAHLAYRSASDDNFFKAWDLNNLNPLIKADNCSKSSIWNGERWIHNYEI